MGHNVSRSSGSLQSRDSSQDSSGEPKNLKRNNNHDDARCLDCPSSSKSLECGHGVCESCIESKKHGDGDTSEEGDIFTCGVCGQTSHFNTSQNNNDTSEEQPDDMPEDKDAKTKDPICQGPPEKCKRLWHHESAVGVCDIAFLNDRSLLYVGNPADPDEFTKTMYSLDEKGRTVDVVLPGDFTSPQSVATSKDGRTVTVLDRVDGDENVIFIFRKDRRVDLWIRTQMIQIYVMQWLDRISVVSEDQISSLTYVDNLVATFTIDGTRISDHRLADEELNITGKFISADEGGNIVVSCPRTTSRNGSVTLIGANNEVLQGVPAEMLCDPRAVCFTKSGHVIVADWGEKCLFLFSRDGALIRTILAMEKEPVCMAIHDDKHVAIGYSDYEISLYQL